jgi:Carbohydrate family 9 binding domain-like
MQRDSIIGLVIAFFTLVFVFFQAAPSAPDAPPPAKPGHSQQFQAVYGSPLIDGTDRDAVWESASWLPLDQVWIGTPNPATADVSGRYKIAWDESSLYVLAEITDDSLVDTHADGLVQYWDDDCLEIFVDEDASGGDHQYNYNAFAYHIALDGRVTDVRPDKSFAYFDDHCTTRRTTRGGVSVWEVAVKIFDGKKYADGADNIPKMLGQGKTMGFALAYCDNDRSPEREHFLGSVSVDGADKNRGWIDAGIFGLLQLK